MKTARSGRHTATVEFLGATRTVTGSKHLLSVNGQRVLVDCGLYQGLKELRLRNWQSLPFRPSELDAVVLTHAHLDHSGYLPRLVRQGFDGPIYATPGTIDLLGLLLPDAAHLEEEDADYANRKGYSKHRPALPLFTLDDARAVLRMLRPVPYGERLDVAPGIELRFQDAGHILGSAFACFRLHLRQQARTVVFSGDLGRYDQPILRDPTQISEADCLVLESTYGDRLHPAIDVKEQLAAIVNQTVEAGGHLLIPSFAVGRAQHLIFLVRELEEERRIPVLPVFLDSPMAASATRLYLTHLENQDPAMADLVKKHAEPLTTRDFRVASSVAQSKAAMAHEGSCIVIAGSGMATGGRILHHMGQRLPDSRTTLLFTGFQSEGTRGRRLLEGEREIKLHGAFIPVRARIAELQNLSAHADYDEILRWLSGFSRRPDKVFLVHGEARAAEALKTRIEQRFGGAVRVPDYAEQDGIA